MLPPLQRRREPPRLSVMFEDIILLQPLLLQPCVELFGSGEGNGGYAEAAPVHVDGRGMAVYVGGAEGIDVLAVLAGAGEGV